MKLAVKKDGHHFYTHVNQLVIDATKPPTQTQEKKTTDSKQGHRGKNAVMLNSTLSYCAVIIGFFGSILAKIYRHVKDEDGGKIVYACVLVCPF